MWSGVIVQTLEQQPRRFATNGVPQRHKVYENNTQQLQFRHGQWKPLET